MTHTGTLILFTAALAGAVFAASPPPARAATPVSGEPAGARYSSASRDAVTHDARQLAEWAVRSRDHQGLPFIIVDKVAAKAFAYNRTGALIRETPVLIGMGRGDTIEPSVLKMNMYHTQPSQRITPAGRFFAEEAPNDQGERVLWVYDEGGIAIHKIPTQRTKQRRHERMVSPNPDDHRITFGCINVTAAFYDQVVRRHFRSHGGIVYVLPETMPIKSVFTKYDTVALQTPRDPAAAGARRF